MHFPPKIRLWAIFLLFSALIIAFIGQSQFSSSKQVSPIPVILFILAAISLVGAEKLVQAKDSNSSKPAENDSFSTDSALKFTFPPALIRFWEWFVALFVPESAPEDSPLLPGWQTTPKDFSPPQSRKRWLLTVVAIALGLRVMWIYAERIPFRNETGPFFPWLFAWLLFFVAWLELPKWPQIVVWQRKYRQEIFGLLILTLLAFGLRTWNLANAPFTVSGDEGSIGQELREILRGKLCSPLILGWGGLPTLTYFVEAFLPSLFGLNALTLRLTTAIAGTLALPALYLLARLLFGRLTATVAALLLLGYQFHLHYSRVVINNTFESFTYPAAFAALVYGLRYQTRSWPFVLTGLFAGISQYTYAGGRLLPLLILAFLGYLFLTKRISLQGKALKLLLLLLFFGVFTGPMLVLALKKPANYNDRLNQIGVIQSGWLAKEQQIQHQGPLPILANQFQHALFGFGFYNDRTVSYNPRGTLANPVMAFFLFLGLGLSLWRWQEPAFALLALWFWAGLITAGMLTVQPPTSNRLFILTPVVTLLAARSLVETTSFLAHKLKKRFLFPSTTKTALLIALLIAFLDITYYFGTYIPSHQFGGEHALIATTLGYELEKQTTPTQVYFFGAPYMWSGFSTIGFLAPNVKLSDVEQTLKAPAELTKTLQLDQAAVFVFLPHRYEELVVVQTRFPQGKFKEYLHPVRNTPFFTTYYVPKAMLNESH